MPPQQEQQQQQQQASPWTNVLFRMMLMYFAYNMLFKGKSNNQSVKSAQGPPHSNLFKSSEKMELLVYISELEIFSDFTNTSALVWFEKDIYYDWTDSNWREKELSFPTPKVIQNNGTLFAHVFFSKSWCISYPSRRKL